jgi:hypothetical protein
MKPLILVALATALACAPAPTPGPGGADTAGVPPAPSAQGPVALTLDRSSYKPGEVVALTLTNSGADQYYFNPCPRTLEREAGGSWTTVDEGQRMCTMEAWILDPNGSRAATTELPGSLEPGRHRMVISLTREGQTPPAQAVQAISAPFDVDR